MRFAMCLLLIVTWASVLYAEGGDGIGITSPPSCGLVEEPHSPCVFSFQDCEGLSDQPPNPDYKHPDYHRVIIADLPPIEQRIDKDIDLLISQSFHDFAEASSPHNSSWEVEEAEIVELLTEIDGNSVNPLGDDYEQWDLALVFNYYTHGNTLYGEFGTNSNFRFDNNFLSHSWPEDERNHVDIYLVPDFEVAVAPCQSQIPGTCCDVYNGTSPAQYRDDEEDAPYSEQRPGACSREYAENSVQVWDHNGNWFNTAHWEKGTVVTFDHEFEHLIQAEHNPNENDYVGLYEFFATTAEYLGSPDYPSVLSQLRDDICYEDPFPLYANNYQIWRTWGVYLLQHFANGPGISDDLVRRWGRTFPARDLTTLPSILKDPEYAKLGCVGCSDNYRGQYRLQVLSNRIGVARWADAPFFETNGAPAGEGPWGYFLGFDPGWDVGMFRRIDPNHCDRAHTLPPVYSVNVGNTAVTNVQCYVHPDDPAVCTPACASVNFCYHATPYCTIGSRCGDPIDLYPWGADAIGFAGDISVMDGNYHELEATFNFAAVPSDCDARPNVVAPCSYRYYVNVITYQSNDTVTELWNRGQNVTSISTYGPYFGSNARELQFIVGDFGCPLIKSVAFVVTLADSVGWQPATAWSDHVRLDYSYSYRVNSPNPGPGFTCPSADPKCPFLYVETRGGTLFDNNILGEGAWNEGEVPSQPDIVEELVLSRQPAVRDGEIKLELREEGLEQTSLDQIQLVSYDVPEGMRLARLVPEGGMGLVGSPRAVGRVFDGRGRDVTEEIAQVDAESIEGVEADYVQFDVVKSSSFGTEIIIVNPLLKQQSFQGEGERQQAAENRAGIVLQAFSGGDWMDVIEFVPKERGELQGVATSLIPGRPGDVVPIRLKWNARHQLDWVAIGTWMESAGTTLNLAAAEHSTSGDVKSQVLSADGRKVSLGTGETIALRFTGHAPSENRHLVLVSTGHYLYPRAFAGGGGAKPRIRVTDNPGVATVSVGRVNAYPNPSRGVATLEVELPAGEDVEVAIYSTNGHLVRKLHEGPMDYGLRRLQWDGRGENGAVVASGQYYYEVRGAKWSKTGKLFMIR